MATAEPQAPGPSRPRLYRIDGSSYVFRAYHALPPLSTRKGEPTGAVYGFTNMLLKTLREGDPTHVAVAFDTKAPTFRHQMYDAYKANRTEPPDDLKPQFGRIREVVEAFNLPVLRKEGWEADDLMGTLAVKARAEGYDVVLVTGDKDFMQLVGPGIRMYDGMRDRWIDEAQVQEKFGVTPALVPDALALIGDSSDNVPGVRGIGEKTAGPLITRFGSLEALLDSLDQISAKGQKKKLEEGQDSARLSKRLVTIDLEAPVDVALEDLVRPEPDLPRLRALLAELEFTRLLQEVAPAKELSREHYEEVTTEAALAALREALEGAPVFAVDTETTSLTAMRAKLVGLSFSTEPGRAWYVPVGHTYAGAPAQLSEETVLGALGGILEDPARKKYAQNAKYDYLVLRRHGVTLRGVMGDPLLFDYLLDPGKGGHGLDDLTECELGHTTIKFSDVAGKGKSQITFDQVPLEKATPYACEDADCTFRLAERLAPRVREAKLWSLFSEVEQPLSTVLAEMEMAGVKLDRTRLETLSIDLAERIDAARAEVHRHAGREFTINSPKQLAEILFTELDLPVVKRTKTGPSTDVTVLEELAHQHPLPQAILEYRRLTKLKSTYVDTLPALIHPETGRVHTCFSQTTAATGRLASSDPNLQNIPIRTGDGRRIREAFVAEAGMALVSADYSQIELRILAHLAEDAALAEAFAAGHDIHARTASTLLGMPLEAVTDEDRRIAKAINFGIVYGMSAFRLARDLGIERREAQRYIDEYFEKHAGVSAWLERTVQAAHEEGIVRTVLGRHRRLPDLKSQNRNVRMAAERAAINTPIQGSAADIIKIAMLRVHDRLPAVCPEGRLILQVHDELMLEVPEAAAESVADWLRQEMEGAFDLSVPLKVDVGWGASWAVAH
jgi:DNA polymerase I